MKPLVAPRGEEALEMCRRKLPNLVILDIMLPDIDGYEVCRRLRGNLRTSHIPIIFLTQKDERSDQIAGLELGADDYITKPFDLQLLLLRVQNSIQRARLAEPDQPGDRSAQQQAGRGATARDHAPQGLGHALHRHQPHRRL